MTDDSMGPVKCKSTDPIVRREIGTTLTNILSLDGNMDVLIRSILVTSILEMMDLDELTDVERIAALYLLSFMAMNLSSFIAMESVELMYALKVTNALRPHARTSNGPGTW